MRARHASPPTTARSTRLTAIIRSDPAATDATSTTTKSTTTGVKLRLSKRSTVTA